MRYLDISPQSSGYGYDISISRILWYRMMWDIISRYIAIYIMPYHTGSPRNSRQTLQQNPATSLRSTVVRFGSFSLSLVALYSVGPFLSSLCCSSDSAGHMIGLTVPPANSNLVPSGLGLLPERMFVVVLFLFYLFCFICFVFFHSLSFLPSWYLCSFVATWYEVPGVNLIGVFRSNINITMFL